MEQIQPLTPAEIGVGAAHGRFHPENAGPPRPTPRNKTAASPAKGSRGCGGLSLPGAGLGQVSPAGAGTHGAPGGGGESPVPSLSPVRGRRRGSAAGTERRVPGVSPQCPRGGNAKDCPGREFPVPPLVFRAPGTQRSHLCRGVLQPGGALLKKTYKKNQLKIDKTSEVWGAEQRGRCCSPRGSDLGWVWSDPGGQCRGLRGTEGTEGTQRGDPAGLRQG